MFVGAARINHFFDRLCFFPHPLFGLSISLSTVVCCNKNSNSSVSQLTQIPSSDYRPFCVRAHHARPSPLVVGGRFPLWGKFTFNLNKISMCLRLSKTYFRFFGKNSILIWWIECDVFHFQYIIRCRRCHSSHFGSSNWTSSASSHCARDRKQFYRRKERKFTESSHSIIPEIFTVDEA